MDEMLIACSQGRYHFATDVRWLTLRKLKLQIPADWPELAAKELASLGMGELQKPSVRTARFLINEKGIVEGLKLADRKRLHDLSEKESKRKISASAWGAILTGFGIVVSVVLAFYHA